MQNYDNNFGVTVSTVNGSGSATANNTIHKAIFKMGIPVSGRNIWRHATRGESCDRVGRLRRRISID